MQTKQKNTIKMQTVVYILTGVLLGIAVTVGCTRLLKTKTDSVDYTKATTKTGKNTANKTNNSDDGSGSYGEDLTFTKISNTDKKNEVAKKVSNYISNIKYNNTYLQTMIDKDQYMSYVYNKNNEIFIQDSANSYTEVMLKNGVAYSLNTTSNMLQKGKDVDPASFIENAFNADKKLKGVTLYKISSDNIKEKGIKEAYRVELSGEEAVDQLYITLGKSFADSMISSMKESIETDNNSKWNPNIYVDIYLSDDFSKSYAYCIYNIGGDPVTNWILQGAARIGTWELSNKWYKYDPTQDQKDNGKQYGKLLNETLNDVTAVITKYATDNNLMTQKEIDKLNKEETDKLNKK